MGNGIHPARVATGLRLHTSTDAPRRAACLILNTRWFPTEVRLQKYPAHSSRDKAPHNFQLTSLFHVPSRRLGLFLVYFTFYSFPEQSFGAKTPDIKHWVTDPVKTTNKSNTLYPSALDHIAQGNACPPSTRNTCDCVSFDNIYRKNP